MRRLLLLCDDRLDIINIGPKKYNHKLNYFKSVDASTISNHDGIGTHLSFTYMFYLIH